MNPAPLVLIVEDEVPMRRLLRATLDAHGYRVVEAGTLAEGHVAATTHNPEIVVLDLGLPDGDGLALVRSLRTWTRVPIVVVSARGRDDDKITALDAGADDYVTKPFSTGELLARLRVALRHAATPAESAPVVVLGALTIDLERRRVTRSEVEIRLTPTEFRLLALLARHPGRVLTHRQILREVWGPNAVEHAHYVRVYLAELRKKIELDPARPCWLLTEAGIGYRLGDGLGG